MEREILEIRELAQRQNDRLTVTLWWVKNTIDTFVTVEDQGKTDDYGLPVIQRIDVVAPATPNDVFRHPFTYLE